MLTCRLMSGERVLLLLPTSTYRTRDFLDAAERLGVEVVVGSEETSALESFQEDCARIESYLAEELDVAFQGVALFACHARGFFHAVPLSLPPENRLTVAQAPRLYQLARMLDNYETYCVVVLSRTRARVFTVAMGKIAEAAELTQTHYQVSKTRKGGWSQPTWQRGIELNIRRFAEEVVAALKFVCEQQRPAHLVLAGETLALAELERRLPRQVSEMVLTTARFDADVPEHRVLAEILPVIETAERQEEEDTVQELESAAAEGELATIGVESTLVALEQGQVDKLVLSNAFAARGWRCQSCLSYGVGGLPTQCPYCSGAILEAGRVVLEGTSAEIQANENVREVYLGLGTEEAAVKGWRLYRKRRRW